MALWRFIAGAPLTYSWLLALLRHDHRQGDLLTKRQLHILVVNDSSTNIKNIMHLAWDTLAVLMDSLLWIDGRYWTPYLVLFTLFLAPAEHWLGQLRWLTVGLTSHFLATYISEGILYVAIRYHDAPQTADARRRHRGQLLSGRRDGRADLPHRAAVALGLSRRYCFSSSVFC